MLKWKCWSCGYTDNILSFNDGQYIQGFDKYRALRCPLCHCFQGRIQTNVKTVSDLVTQLTNYMRNRQIG